jgi:hypothetical protein
MKTLVNFLINPRADGAIAAAFVLHLATGLACAQAPDEVVREFGPFGTWARDCQAEPGPSNPYTIISETSRGGVFLRDDFGPIYGDMIYRVVEAKRIGQFRISLRQLLTTDENVALRYAEDRRESATLVIPRYGWAAVRGRWTCRDGQQPRDRMDRTVRREMGGRRYRFGCWVVVTSPQPTPAWLRVNLFIANRLTATLAKDRYPDWSGQWARAYTGPARYDPSEPPAAGQERAISLLRLWMYRSRAACGQRSFKSQSA